VTHDFHHCLTPPALDDPDDDLHVVRIPLRIGDRWALSGRYVEFVWSEIMGPTATLLARRLGDLLDRRQDGDDLSIRSISRSLGVPPSNVRRALSRLDRHHLVSLRVAESTVATSGLVPSVGFSRLTELSDLAQREHRWQVDEAKPVQPSQAQAPGRGPQRRLSQSPYAGRTP
jgi:DNA-binding transcriptional ArsR family regulator